ncbi:MAG: tetratricopeptide repeat protein [bacterium]|jgi:tetratricopeptide (TPR) repeat protein
MRCYPHVPYLIPDLEPAQGEPLVLHELVMKSFKAVITQAYSGEWARMVRALLEEGSPDAMNSEMLDHKRTLSLDEKRKRLSGQTLHLAQEFIQTWEHLILQTRQVQQLQFQLEYYQQPERRQFLSEQKKAELRQKVLQLRDAQEELPYLQERSRQLFEPYWQRRCHELVEEASLRAALDEYLKWVDPRVKGHLESQIRSQSEALNYEERIPTYYSFVNQLITLTPSIARADKYRLVLLGKTLLEEHNPQAAQEQFTQALRYDRRDGELYALLAECHQKKLEIDQAIGCLKKALECKPNQLRYLLTLARLFHQQRDFKNAFAYYARAFQLRPGDPALQDEFAVIAYEAEEWKTAAALLRKIHARKPESVKILRRFGIALVQSDDLEQGIQILKEVLHYADDDPQIHYFLGIAYRKLGHYQPAFEEFQFASLRQMENLDYQLAFAQAYFDQGEYKESSRLARLILSRKPGHEPALVLLAGTLRQQGEDSAAFDLLHQLMETGPPSLELQREYCHLCLRTEHQELAYQLLSSQIPLVEQHNDLRQLLGLACLHTRRFQEAAQWLDLST